jgi:hypothetical protein
MDRDLPWMAAAIWAGRRCCLRRIYWSRTSSDGQGEPASADSELNVLNVFNQQTVRHTFNYLNPRPRRCRDQSRFDGISRGIRLQSHDPLRVLTGRMPFEPRYQQDDMFNPGTTGTSS